MATGNKKKVALLVFVLALLSSIVCNYAGITSGAYKHLYFLPLITGIIILFIGLLPNKIEGKAPIIICLVYCVRNIVGPFVLSIDDFQTKFNYLSASDIDNAIFLTIYETLAVAVYIFLFAYRNDYKADEETGNLCYSNPVYFATLICGFLLSAFALVNSVELRNSFFSIFKTNFYEANNDVQSYGSGHVLFNGGKVLIDSLRFVIPSTLIIVLKNRLGSNRFIVFISIIIACLQAQFMTDGNAYILMLVVVQLALVYKLHPQYQKDIKQYILIIGIASVFLITTHRFLQEESAYRSSFSVFIQSYFGGITDVAGIFKVTREKTMLHMLTDFYSNVPFRSTLFGYSGDDILIVTIYNQENYCHAQILPTIAESYYYFGAILSPLFSIILVSIGIYYERKANNESHYLYYAFYCLISLVACIGSVAYDMRIFLLYALNKFLFMWIFIKLSDGIPLYMIQPHEKEDFA